ncbi:MAG TPA: ABC transporter ATP-binding protein [Acidimicrobiales bacterium]|nr:ABC transporter ATP-binding protein [Acidimicrobiales bacterium]
MSSSDRRRAALRLAIRRYARRAWRDRRWSIAGIVLPGIGNVLVHILPTLVVAKVLTAMLGAERPTFATIGPWVGLFAVCWMGGELTWRLAVHFIIKTEARGLEALYVEGLDDLLGKDLAFFHDNFAGSLTKKVIGYAANYERVIDTLAFSVVSNLVPLVIVGPVLWTFSPWLAITLMGMIVLTGLAIWPLILRRRALVDVREAASNSVAGHVADTLANMDAVRVFAQEQAEALIHRRNVAEYTKRMKRSWNYQNLRIDMVTGPLYVLTNVLGILVATMVARRGTAGFETVFITFSYYVTCTRVVWEFNDIYRNLETALAEAAQFAELLLDEPTVLDPEDAIALAPRHHGVEFRSVTFAHGGREDAPLFRDFDLQVAPGEKVGLVGRSGGGKTTLTHLLLRLIDIDDGTILVGGQDISRLRQADVRGLIATVPQDPAMFHRSLRDNIAFGRPDATEDEIIAAAVAAHAAEFIEELPDGYATLVGERGVKLSGGQRQRVAIARAILRRSPVLVLDEATSSLDSESEALIQPALLSLMEDRTAIVIAHRLSTVQRMDRLVVLDRGRVVEQGTHAQLVAAGGTYAMLWSHQSGGFLVDDNDVAA